MIDATKTALFVTFHHWMGSRQGGFHKLAEALCGEGYDVGFLSFPRPWYGVLKRSERESASRMLSLVVGKRYRVRAGTVLNFTVPTFGLPGRLWPLVGHGGALRLERAAAPSVATVCRHRVPDPDVVMFESTTGTLLFDQLTRRFPRALTIYRPSDPLVADPALPPGLRLAERNLLQRADLVLLVDEHARAVYARAFPGLDLDGDRVLVLRNGVDLQPFTDEHPRPAVFGDDRPVALYLGAHVPDWSVLAAAARSLPGVRFVAVCPERPSRAELTAFLASRNAVYVPGVPPGEVPRYVTNCDVVMVPYPSNARLLTLGITAKMLQAMAARKPLVALHVNPCLAQSGIVACSDTAEFARAIAAAAHVRTSTYPIDVAAYGWQQVQSRFVELVRAHGRTHERCAR